MRLGVRRITARVPRPFILDVTLYDWTKELWSLISEGEKQTEEVERRRQEHSLLLYPFRPGWVLIFYPLYIWPALKIIRAYLELAIKGRCPAENSPTEKSILDLYWKIYWLTDDIYNRLKVHDISTASNRIDDLSNYVDDIGNMIELNSDVLQWNGTYEVHRAAYGFLTRLRDKMVSARNRMLQELNRPRYFSLESYEIGVNTIWAVYNNKREYWERLSEDTCKRFIRMRRVALSPLWIHVYPKQWAVDDGYLSSSSPFKVYASPYFTPCHPLRGDTFLVAEEGRVYWRVLFLAWPKGNSYVYDNYYDKFGEVCKPEEANVDLRVEMTEPQVLKITMNGGKSIDFRIDVYYGDNLLWRKNYDRTWEDMGVVGEITEVNLVAYGVTGWR